MVNGVALTFDRVSTRLFMFASEFSWVLFGPVWPVPSVKENVSVSVFPENYRILFDPLGVCLYCRESRRRRETGPKPMTDVHGKRTDFPWDMFNRFYDYGALQSYTRQFVHRKPPFVRSSVFSDASLFYLFFFLSNTRAGRVPKRVDNHEIMLRGWK